MAKKKKAPKRKRKSRGLGMVDESLIQRVRNHHCMGMSYAETVDSLALAHPRQDIRLAWHAAKLLGCGTGDGLGGLYSDWPKARRSAPTKAAAQRFRRLYESPVKRDSARRFFNDPPLPLPDWGRPRYSPGYNEPWYHRQSGHNYLAPDDYIDDLTSKRGLRGLGETTSSAGSRLDAQMICGVEAYSRYGAENCTLRPRDCEALEAEVHSQCMRRHGFSGLHGLSDDDSPRELYDPVEPDPVEEPPTWWYEEGWDKKKWPAPDRSQADWDAQAEIEDE